MKKLTFLVIIILACSPNLVFSEDLNKCMSAWNAKQAGNYSTALRLFDECIKKGNLTPSSLARTYRNIGLTYQSQGSLKKAINALTKAIEMNPPDVYDDYLNRGNTYDMANKFEEAMKDYELALKSRPGYAMVYFDRGIAYEHYKMFDKAKTEFIEAYKHGLRTLPLIERFMLYGIDINKELGSQKASPGKK